MRIFIVLSLLILFISPNAIAQHTFIPIDLDTLNDAGIWLLVLGLTFILMELFVFTFGFLGGLGLVALISGAIILFGLPTGIYPLPWPFIAMICLFAVAFFAFIIKIVVSSMQKKTKTGAGSLIGSEGFVISERNEQITVRVLGEIWQASSSHLLHPGDRVKVTHIHGLVLMVQPMNMKKNKHELLGE